MVLHVIQLGHMVAAALSTGKLCLLGCRRIGLLRFYLSNTLSSSDIAALQMGIALPLMDAKVVVKLHHLLRPRLQHRDLLHLLLLRVQMASVGLPLVVHLVTPLELLAVAVPNMGINSYPYMESCS